MMPSLRELLSFLDNLAAEALASGDQPILDLIEEFCDAHGFGGGER